ncbi:hypothetical protein [Nonomuraea jiangxiensis]|uniref:hypothetical protein n=1 Tax=Nonomuraea jiangxiensis TaxID=633440 RepID=UPI00115FADD7|nr:hypothetical protein [Nonomuraea jiangxiensis]
MIRQPGDAVVAAEEDRPQRSRRSAQRATAPARTVAQGTGGRGRTLLDGCGNPVLLDTFDRLWDESSR